MKHPPDMVLLAPFRSGKILSGNRKAGEFYPLFAAEGTDFAAASAKPCTNRTARRSRMSEQAGRR
jgi:hypothetical protein